MASSLSNKITAFLNFVAVMCSIPVISAGIWLASNSDNQCVHWLRWPLVFIGVALLLIALAGFAGAYWNKEGLLGVYLVSMAILIVLLLSLLILASVVTRPDGSYAVPGRRYRDYRLPGYSAWLRDHVTGDDYWADIRACLAADHDICPAISNNYFTAELFFAARLSPLQSGCCKPPTICGYQYVSPTMWINPSYPMIDADCSIWNNDPTQLCYNCDSCKAGLLGNLRSEWRKVNVILIVTVVLLISVYFIACSAYKNAQTNKGTAHGRK
ncbi:tetraspanin-2 [Ipomoea triloba]|uniref:tetraspanin-2 n=1 Tax=Ipomoea triloba TaxID=35885 RepID=UPI00125DC070|nr:tetraspanin-2 [Ipomoea triloba]